MELLSLNRRTSARKVFVELLSRWSRSDADNPRTGSLLHAETQIAAERLGQMGARTLRASAPRFFKLRSGGKPAASSEVARWSKKEWTSPGNGASVVPPSWSTKGSLRESCPAGFIACVGLRWSVNDATLSRTKDFDNVTQKAVIKQAQPRENSRGDRPSIPPCALPNHVRLRSGRRADQP